MYNYIAQVKIWFIQWIDYPGFQNSHSKDFFNEGTHTSWKDLLEYLPTIEKYPYIYGTS